MNTIEKYREAVAFIDGFSNRSIRKNLVRKKRDPSFFLDRPRYFLDLLGKPDKDLHYVHITGTAGKGTVSTMVQESLVASGKKVGLFTSPYVTTAAEKIRVNDKYIAPQELVRLIEYIKPFIEKAKKGPFGAPSAFDLYFALAILYFKQKKCEWAVLEVGLGGRYDSTNVIAKPEVTAITNIDYDHTEILGDTLREIATDKAGIIKKGSAFFTSEQRPALQKIFKKICKEKGVSFYAVPKQKNYSYYNQELVRAISKHIGLADKAIDTGIRNTKLSCRFEVMQNKPLVILDGAHNRVKIASTISNVHKTKYKNLYLIVAVADNKKDNRAILKPLLQLPHLKKMILTRISTPERRTLYPALLLEEAKRHKNVDTRLEILEDCHLALKQTLKSAKKDDLVLVTGSFFLAGELRKHWVSEEQVLRKRKLK